MNNVSAMPKSKITLDFVRREKNGQLLYIHHWATGNQELLFRFHESAQQFLTEELRREANGGRA